MGFDVQGSFDCGELAAPEVVHLVATDNNESNYFACQNGCV